MRSLLTYLLCAATFASAAAGYAKVSERSLDPQPPERSQASQQPNGQKADWLRMRLQLDGLYPGARLWALVRVRNLTHRPLTLRSIRPNVRAFGAARDCAAYLAVERRRLNRLLPPRSLRWVKLRVAMDAHAGDSCQGAKLPTGLRARATRGKATRR